MCPRRCCGPSCRLVDTCAPRKSARTCHAVSFAPRRERTSSRVRSEGAFEGMMAVDLPWLAAGRHEGLR